MSSKLLASTLLAASLLAAPAIAFAQTSAPPDNTGPSGAESQRAPKTMHHSMKSSHMKKGTTTGMSSSKTHRESTTHKSDKSAY